MANRLSKSSRALELIAKAVKAREVLAARGENPEKSVFVVTPEEFDELVVQTCLPRDMCKRLAGLELVVM